MATRIVRATETGYTIEARTRCHAEYGFAKPDGKQKAGGRADNAAREAEQRGFREKQAQHATGGAADSFHQADIIFALHGDVGHGGHDAQPGESQHQRGCGGEQSADASVNFGFGIGELAQAMDVGGGNILREGGDVIANFARSSGHTYLYEADFVGKRGETLRGVEIHDDLAVLGVAAGLGNF